MEATQDTGSFVQLSGVLKRIACKLSKICNDLRLLSSGPQAGLGEIFLPARAAGSSIMPGKVNPVIPEVVNQVAFEVIGNDMAVTMASEAGQLQLNAFEPLIGYSLFKSITHLQAACATLATNCVDGITANRALLADAFAPRPGWRRHSTPTSATKTPARSRSSPCGMDERSRTSCSNEACSPTSELQQILQLELLTRPTRVRSVRPGPDSSS